MFFSKQARQQPIPGVVRLYVKAGIIRPGLGRWHQLSGGPPLSCEQAHSSEICIYKFHLGLVKWNVYQLYLLRKCRRLIKVMFRISLDFPGFPQPKVALVKVFFTVDNENRQLEDLSLADFGRVPELISSVVKDKVSKWEFCL